MRAVLLGAAVVVLLAGCGSSKPTSTADATLFGRVLAAPSCPVERAGMPCPPRPVAGARVEAVQHGDVVSSTHTDQLGRFQLQLRPGEYLIRATNAGGIASTAQQRTYVRNTGPAQTIRLVVDSGIR